MSWALNKSSIALRSLPPAEPRRRDRKEARATRADGLDPSAAALFQQLRELRTTLAKSEGIAAYMVFADRTLIEMAERAPSDAVQLRELHGVGERKLQRYGARFLAEIEAFQGRSSA